MGRPRARTLLGGAVLEQARSDGRAPRRAAAGRGAEGAASCDFAYRRVTDGGAWDPALTHIGDPDPL